MRAAALVVVAVLAACSQAPAPVVQVPPVVPSVVVAPGDSVYAIARRHGVSMRGIIEANGLAPPYLLALGRRLVLPRERVHAVVPGDTLYEISRRYGIDMATLARANRLRPPYALIAGRRLRIPDAGSRRASAPTPVGAAPPRIAAPIATPTPAPAATPTAAPTATPTPAPAGMPTAAPAAPIPPAKPLPAQVAASPKGSATARFYWPVKGQVIARFGRRPGGLYNEGINIAAPKGTPVRAAAAGVVAYAGNQLRGYGRLVLIRHPGGWITAYAHNDAILVRVGQHVRRGQTIARVGASGRVRSPQSHFEIRRGIRAIDPETLLAAP